MDLVTAVDTLCVDEISDQKLVFCVLNAITSRTNPRSITYRSFVNFDHEAFLTDPYALNWFNIIYEKKY